jgi:hypothetical protein
MFGVSRTSGFYAAWVANYGGGNGGYMPRITQRKGTALGAMSYGGRETWPSAASKREAHL